MNPRYKPPRINRDELKKIVEDFIREQKYERTMAKIMSGDWIPRGFLNKNKLAQKRLHEHVSFNDHFIYLRLHPDYNFKLFRSSRKTLFIYFYVYRSIATYAFLIVSRDSL
jgi:hypothetical protein